MLESDTAALCRLPHLLQNHFSLLFKFLICEPSVYCLPLFASLTSLRCNVAQGKWVPCNVHVQRACHFPVYGLEEGMLYRFRVRAANKAGSGRPSKATEPVLTADPLEHTRTMCEWSIEASNLWRIEAKHTGIFHRSCFFEARKISRRSRIKEHYICQLGGQTKVLSECSPALLSQDREISLLNLANIRQKVFFSPSPL